MPLLVTALMPPPREGPLAHVEGRHDQLDFLDGVQTDRLRARLPPGVPVSARPKTSDGAVNLHVVVAVVAPGDVMASQLPAAAEPMAKNGEVRAKSLMLRLMVGSVSSACSDTLAARCSTISGELAVTVTGLLGDRLDGT